MFQETEATLFPSQIPRFFTRWLISSFFVSPDLPQQHVYKREEILMDRQLCKQERNSSPDVKEPQPSTIKEEQEDLCISQDLDQPIVKQEYNIVTVTYEESDQSEPEHEHQTHEEFNRSDSSIANTSPPSKSRCSTGTGKKSVQSDLCGKAYYRLHTSETPTWDYT